MADPTIQTFCCHHANGTDMAVTIMEEFDTDAYNSVCLFSSALGILGAAYQVGCSSFIKRFSGQQCICTMLYTLNGPDIVKFLIKVLLNVLNIMALKVHLYNYDRWFFS